jgi:hypothetical protein
MLICIDLGIEVSLLQFLSREFWQQTTYFAGITAGLALLYCTYLQTRALASDWESLCDSESLQDLFFGPRGDYSESERFRLGDTEIDY